MPRPRILGAFFCVLCLACFLVGKFRGELVLSLIALVFAFALLYSFITILVLSFIYKKKATYLNARVIPEKVKAGSQVSLMLNLLDGGGSTKKKIFKEFPAVLIRYRLNLSTKDNKKIDFICGSDIWEKKEAVFHAPLRGAYFGSFDKLEIFDVFGFFYFSFKIFCTHAERLICTPHLIENAPAISGFSGGETRREERSVMRTDDFIEQREYIPGDDPRRINWKIYGHSGNLFVREEDRAPPPHSTLVVLISAEADGALFSGRANKQKGFYQDALPGAEELDRLCECAMSIVEANKNLEVIAGGSGLALSKNGNTMEEITNILSRFYVLKDKVPELPAVGRDSKIVILSLPFKDFSKTNSIDRFLEKHSAAAQKQKIEILFLYKDGSLKDAAESSAILYGRKVRASAVRL